MKKLITTLFVAVLATTIGLPEAEAKRLGGGRSSGMQRDTVTQKQAAPANTQQAAPATPAAGAPAAAPKRNWMGPIAGLAAGLGLATLFSHLGLGAGMANFVMILLLMMAAVFVFRLIFRRPASPAAQTDSAMQYVGVGGPGMAPPPKFDPIPAGSGVSNPVPGTGAALAATPASATALPADFDAPGFIRVAKVQFVRMQAAHDAGNLEDIREFTTPEMFAEIKLDLDERQGRQQQTEVLNVDAEVLEVVTEATRYVASVRFRGMIREEQGAPDVAFDEVWNLVKPLQGGGWILAGVQQLN